MKRTAVIAVLVIAILAILVAAVPYLIPDNFLKARIAAQISAWTGRTVAISGEPSFSVYPTLAVTVDGLTIGNPQGMGDDPFVAAEGLRATLRMLPLLVGRTEFEEVELIKARIHLVVGSDGSTNWRLAESAITAVAPVSAPDASGAAPSTAPIAANKTAPEAAPGPAVAPGTPEAARTRATDVQIGRLKISAGTILYDDLVSDRREEMTGLELEVFWPSASAAAGGSGSLQWRGETVEFNGSVTKPLALVGGGVSAVRFALAATPLRLSLAGKASTVGAFQLDGTASVTTPSMRRAIEWFGTPMGTGAILGAASIAGTAQWLDSRMTFDAAAIELDGNAAEGSLSVSFAGPRPAVQATLAATKLDLTPYFEAARADLAANGSWLLAPIQLKFAEAVDADLRISTGETLIGATRIGTTAATVVTRNGAIDVSVGEAKFYGGQLEARIGVRMEGDFLVANANARIAAVPARVVLSDLASVAALDGTATAQFDLNSRGTSWGEFALSIAGAGKVAIGNGSLTGFDANEVARMFADPLAEPMPAGTGTTTFSDLTATFAISDGTLATEDLSMEGTSFHLILAGRGSLLSGAIDAKAVLSSGSTDVPLAITGLWREPRIERDLTRPRPGIRGTISPAAPPTGG